jgi:hypothetical protein
MTIMQRLRAKQKADAMRAAEQAEKRRAARIAKKVAPAAAKDDGLNDLPLAVAIAIELNPAQPVKPEPSAPAAMDDSVPGLVARLTAIREKIWRLQAMFATTLSPDCLLDANKYLTLFQSIAEQLRAKDAGELDALTRGHESLLLSPSIPLKQSVPLSTQKLVEMRWEAMTQPTQRAPKRPSDEIHDGLSCLFY